ncbi:hypothetical protein IID20_01200 [Patescibacteria group bacterium]|nr:hypothetical protein [Patescibacteria group bacterium]
MDYSQDRYGRECLKYAQKSRSDIGFGAVLVKGKKIIGCGWNRRSTFLERKLLSHVDYAIHAEQACIADAILRGVDIQGSRVYVLGIVLRGKQKGKLTARNEKVFICRKCPPTFIRFKVSVYIPCFHGWVHLSPKRAAKTAKEVCGNGYWRKFIQKK